MAPQQSDHPPHLSQSYENALRLERHSVMLEEIKRRLGNIEKALWGVAAAVGMGLLGSLVAWVVQGGMAAP